MTMKYDPFAYFTTKLAINHSEKHRVTGSHRADTCLQCDEVFGSRLVVPVGDDVSYELYHVKCADLALADMKEEARLKFDADQEALKQACKAERDVRIKARGTILDFIDPAKSWDCGRDDPERKFASIVAGAVRRQERGKQELVEWADELKASVDPLNEMSWSRKMFTVAAQIRIAGAYVIPAFQAGSTLEDLRLTVQRDFVQKARSCSNRSTSPTSNIADDCEIEELAQLYGSLNGDAFAYSGYY